MNETTTTSSRTPTPFTVAVRAEWTDMDGQEHVVVKRVPWTARGKRYVATLSNRALCNGGFCKTQGCFNNGGEAA